MAICAHDRGTIRGRDAEGDRVNLELVINPTVVARSYRKLVELTEDAITLREIGTQAFHDWRLMRKSAEALAVLAGAKAARLERGA